MIGSGRRRESRIVIARVPPSITPPTKAAMACVSDIVGCGWRLVELLAGSVGVFGAYGGGGLQPRRGGGFEGAHSTLTWPGEIGRASCRERGKIWGGEETMENESTGREVALNYNMEVSQ